MMHSKLFVVTSTNSPINGDPLEATVAQLCKYQVFTSKNINKFNFYRQILAYSKYLL